MEQWLLNVGWALTTVGKVDNGQSFYHLQLEIVPAIHFKTSVQRGLSTLVHEWAQQSIWQNGFFLVYILKHLPDCGTRCGDSSKSQTVTRRLGFNNWNARTNFDSMVALQQSSVHHQNPDESTIGDRQYPHQSDSLEFYTCFYCILPA